MKRWTRWLVFVVFVGGAYAVGLWADPPLNPRKCVYNPFECAGIPAKDRGECVEKAYGMVIKMTSMPDKDACQSFPLYQRDKNCAISDNATRKCADSTVYMTVEDCGCDQDGVKATIMERKAVEGSQSCGIVI